MSDNIPFDIQTQIIKKLPIKSVVQFRCVSKQWKSLIDDAKFIKSYHMNHHHHQHLLVRYNVQQQRQQYVSIIDNDTFPEHKSPFPLTVVPLPVKILKELDPARKVKILGSLHGIICFHGYRKDHPKKISEMAVLWNPSVRKWVGIVIPGNPVLEELHFSCNVETVCVGFGVCPETHDPKLVKIYSTIGGIPYQNWEVKVYTLSSHAWRNVSVKPPCKSCNFDSDDGVCVKGFIYWLGHDTRYSKIRSYLIVSFDLTKEEFGQVYLPDSLLHSEFLRLYNRNECLTVLDYAFEDRNYGQVCSVWMMKDDDVTKCFTKMFCIKSRGSMFNEVLEFRNNGEAIIQTCYRDGDDNYSALHVYDPCTGHINDSWITGNFRSFSISSYVETLLLLDE